MSTMLCRLIEKDKRCHEQCKGGASTKLSSREQVTTSDLAMKGQTYVESYEPVLF